MSGSSQILLPNSHDTACHPALYSKWTVPCLQNTLVSTSAVASNIVIILQITTASCNHIKWILLWTSHSSLGAPNFLFNKLLSLVHIEILSAELLLLMWVFSRVWQSGTTININKNKNKKTYSKVWSHTQSMTAMHWNTRSAAVTSRN